nr:ribonuclease HIII [Methanomicrobium sp. W14]
MIGTDESGKGDYFGPLVAAGMYTDKKIAVVLRQAKVRDSKLMTDEEIKKTAEIIRDNFPGCYSIIEISPMKYNKLYSEFRKENKNLNHLLAWAHAKAIEEILSKKECQTAISDKFGDEKYILSKLQEKGRKISLIQVTKAERNIAVAAASVLARDRFLGKLDELSESAGFRLPKGASKKVITAGRKIVDKEGKEALKRYAKIHFKTTGDITGIKP